MIEDTGFFFTALVVGLVAQLIDGAIGMAYGVTSSLALISLGSSPAIASASVHTAQVFTTLVSGGSHFKFGNVRKDILLPLAAFGIVGGALGAYGLTSLPAGPVRLVVNVVLLSMGCTILYKHVAMGTVTRREPKYSSKHLSGLGFIGAFIDAVGGGGWGPVCTSTLVATGTNPSKAVGSVNLAEFFVTTAQTLTFLCLIGWERFRWEAVVGLVLAGVVVAPFSAYACGKMPRRLLGILVGMVVVFLTARNLTLIAL